MFVKSQFAHLCNDINTSLPVLKVAWRRNGSLMSSVQHLRKASEISQGHAWFKPAFPRTAAFELEELSSVTAWKELWKASLDGERVGTLLGGEAQVPFEITPGREVLTPSWKGAFCFFPERALGVGK